MKPSIVPVGAKTVFQIAGSVGYIALKKFSHYTLYNQHLPLSLHIMQQADPTESRKEAQ
jgi:hypothetical protein